MKYEDIKLYRPMLYNNKVSFLSSVTAKTPEAITILVCHPGGGREEAVVQENELEELTEAGLKTCVGMDWITEWLLTDSCRNSDCHQHFLGFFQGFPLEVVVHVNNVEIRFLDEYRHAEQLRAVQDCIDSMQRNYWNHRGLYIQTAYVAGYGYTCYSVSFYRKIEE